MNKNISTKLLVFIISFLVIFYIIKISGLFSFASTVDATSLSGLFSVVGVIFGVISGFIIQVKWNNWDKLVEASHSEISIIMQLHTVIHHLPKVQRQIIEKNISDYLQATIDGNSGKTKNSLQSLEESIYQLFVDQEVTNIDSIAYKLFSQFTDWHEKRINYSQEHLLPVIRAFVFGNAIMIGILSLLLPVENLILDLIFTFCIAFLSYSVYLLIDDLDNPYRPGNWHLSTNNYANLLSDLRNH